MDWQWGKRSEMRFLPIVERELRVASRRGGTYWNRTLAGLLAVILCGFLVLEAAQSAPGEAGQVLFHALSVVFGLFSLLAGIRYTADSLSQEKRDGTLGLLFLTDLKGYDVVLGKLAGTSVHGVSGLLAILPVLVVPVLLGGVTFGECARMVLVLVNAMVFSLAAGLLASAVSRQARKAMLATFLLVMLVHAGLPGLGAYAEQKQWISHSFWISLPSLGFAYLRSSDLSYQAQPGLYWASVASTHGLTWLFLAGASGLVRHSWQDRPTDAPRSGWREAWRRRVYGTEESARAFRRRSLEENPCLWLGVRHRLRPLVIWGVLGWIGLGWVGGWVKWGRDWREIEVLVLVMYLMHLGLKLLMASESCQRLGPERRDGTLELLLSTPLTIREILSGQMLVLRRQFGGPVLLVLGLDLLVLMAGWLHPGAWSPQGWLWFGAVGIGTFLADMYTLAWVGLWVGLTARQGSRATGATVARVLVLPWLVWVGVMVLLETGRGVSAGMVEGGFYLTLWVAIALINNALFLVWSRVRLGRDLRTLASERYGGGGLSWWFRADSSSASGPG
jgi:ABC-type transport system involved in multi-copper enzyme maturation permease subunit